MAGMRSKENGIDVAAILEPILPLDDMSYVKGVMDEFK